MTGLKGTMQTKWSNCAPQIKWTVTPIYIDASFSAGPHNDVTAILDVAALPCELIQVNGVNYIINFNYSLYVQYTSRHTSNSIFIMFLLVFTAANVCKAVTVMIHDG